MYQDLNVKGLIELGLDFVFNTSIKVNVSFFHRQWVLKQNLKGHLLFFLACEILRVFSENKKEKVLVSFDMTDTIRKFKQSS